MRTPSLRKHSSGQARVTLNGRDFLLGAWGSKESRQAYHRLIAEWEASGRSSTFGCEPESIAIVEVVAMYLKFCRKYYGDGRTTEINTIIPAMKALRSLYGETTAVKFGPLQFKALRAFLMKPVKRKLKSGKIKESVRSRTYINALMKRVRRLFKWASSESILPGSIYTNLSCVEPLKRGRTTAPERERVEPVEEMVVAKTIEHLSPTVAAMVRFQQLTGCRPGEVCSIKSGMVDRSKDVWEICMNKHKNAWRGKARTIYVGPEAQKVLAPFLLRDANSYCFSPREAEEKRREQASENRTPPLNQGNRPGYSKRRREGAKLIRKIGECYTTPSYGKAIARACEEAFPIDEKMQKDELHEWKRKHYWSPGRLRHSMATKIRRAYGIEAASVLLGHSDVDVTQVYAEADREKAIDVIRRIG